jgi:Na+/melibiose symporter-like transporter
MTRFRPWLLVLAVFAGLATAYFFAFRAAHQAQIKEVPLATKGGRP